jgi:hypothetical protein
MGKMTTVPKDDDDDLLRAYCLPEEDIVASPYVSRAIGGFRWFRSANIIDMWQYRQPPEQQQIVGRLRQKSRAICNLVIRKWLSLFVNWPHMPIAPN